MQLHHLKAEGARFQAHGVLLLALSLTPSFAQSQYFEGLAHDPRGQAQIAVQPQGLHVSNLGSSGQDGVRIHLGDAEALTVGHDLSLPPGGSVSIVGRGTTTNSPAVRSVSMTYARTAQGTEITPTSPRSVP